MPAVEFATLIFQGARFDEARMPVDALPELAAYRAIVLAVARNLFRKENPERVRVPKGFESAFQLFLERIEAEHSVLDVVSRSTPVGQLSFGDIYDRARDVVEDGIRAAAEGAILPAALSNGALAQFSSFGRTLQPSERILIGKPQSSIRATWDRNVRERFIKLAKTSYEDPVDLVGTIYEANKLTAEFEFETSNGERIPVNPSPFISEASRAFYFERPVRLKGMGMYNQMGNVVRIVDVADIDDAVPEAPPGCPTTVEDQMRAFAALEHGWLDETTPSFDQQHLVWFAALLGGIIAAFELPIPYVYPAASGRVRAEWSAANAEVLATIDAANQTADILVVRGPDVALEELVALSRPGGESRFGRILADHLTGRPRP